MCVWFPGGSSQNLYLPLYRVVNENLNIWYLQYEVTGYQYFAWSVTVLDPVTVLTSMSLVVIFNCTDKLILNEIGILFFLFQWGMLCLTLCSLCLHFTSYYSLFLLIFVWQLASIKFPLGDSLFIKLLLEVLCTDIFKYPWDDTKRICFKQKLPLKFTSSIIWKL